MFAKILYHYNMELTLECQQWTDDLRVNLTWEKPPLLIFLEPSEEP